LAIIQLPSDIPVRYLPLGDNREYVTYFSAGFGSSTGNPNTGLRISTSLLTSSPGLGTLAYAVTTTCPPDGYRDTLCTLYSPRNFAPYSAGAGACEGDSGEPLVGIDRKGTRLLIGVEGEVNGSSPHCDASSDLLTTFTDIRRHLNWIRANVDVRDPSPVASPKCREVLLEANSHGYQIEVPPVSLGRAVVTVTSAGSPNNAAPEIAEVTTGSQATCQTVLNLPNLLWCQVTNNQRIRLRVVGKGHVQLSICSFG
jgi:hypothetical protein